MYSRTIGHVGAPYVLVEDEPFVREATCCILESAGFEVLPAEDAQDAMKVYEECKRGIDLVMTDMMLPGRSGEQLGQDLREQSPEVVVLVTSGYSNLEYETECPGRERIFWRSRIRGGRWSRRLKRFLGRCRWGGGRRKRASDSANYPFDPNQDLNHPVDRVLPSSIPSLCLPCVPCAPGG